MAINYPLNPLSTPNTGLSRPVGGRTPQQQPFGEVSGNSGQEAPRSGKVDRIPQQSPQSEASGLDYGELIRQARLQRVGAAQSRQGTSQLDNAPTTGRAISAYRDQARYGETGGAELVRFDETA